MNIGNEKETLKSRLELLIEQKKDSDYSLSETKQAELMNIPYQTFHKYVKGTAECSISNLAKIANYYKVSTDYLLGITDIPSLKKNIQNACKTTGLSQKAITAIIKFKEIGMGFDETETDIYCSLKNALDMFITSNYSFSLLIGLANMNVVTKKYVKMILNHCSRDELIKKSTGARLQFFENIEDFRRVLKSVNHPLYERAEEYYSKYYSVIDGFEDNEEIIKQSEIELQELRELYEKEVAVDAEHNPKKE